MVVVESRDSDYALRSREHRHYDVLGCNSDFLDELADGCDQVRTRFIAVDTAAAGRFTKAAIQQQVKDME